MNESQYVNNVQSFKRSRYQISVLNLLKINKKDTRFFYHTHRENFQFAKKLVWENETVILNWRYLDNLSQYYLLQLLSDCFTNARINKLHFVQ